MRDMMVTRVKGLLVLLSFSILELGRLADAWGYSAPDLPTPDRWAELYPSCANTNVTLQAPVKLHGRLPGSLSIGFQQMTHTAAAAVVSPSSGDAHGVAQVATSGHAAPVAGAGAATTTAEPMWQTVVNTVEPLLQEVWTFDNSHHTTELTRSGARVLESQVFRISGEKPGLLQGQRQRAWHSAPITVRRGLTTYTLGSFKLHDGAEHSDALAGHGDLNTTLVPVAEIQWVFHANESGPASMVLCQPLYQETGLVAVNASDASSETFTLPTQGFLEHVLSEVSLQAPDPSAAAATGSGASNTVTVISILETDNLHQKILPTIEDGVSQGTFIEYTGSTTTPPCTNNVQTLVSRHAIGISQVHLDQLRSLTGVTSSDAHHTARRPAFEPLPQGNYNFRNLVVANQSARATAAPTTVLIKNDALNERLRKAIIALSVVACTLFLAIIILLLARFEFFELPTAWGGLAKGTEEWVNPPTHHSWSDVEKDSDNDWSDEDEEEEDEEEEEEEEDEQALMQY